MVIQTLFYLLQDDDGPLGSSTRPSVKGEGLTFEDKTRLLRIGCSPTGHEVQNGQFEASWYQLPKRWSLELDTLKDPSGRSRAVRQPDGTLEWSYVFSIRTLGAPLTREDSLSRSSVVVLHEPTGTVVAFVDRPFNASDLFEQEACVFQAKAWLSWHFQGWNDPLKCWELKLTDAAVRKLGTLPYAIPGHGFAE